MQPERIIVIGAGAAGLMAAYELVKEGKEVIILEGRERVGGRIHTLSNNAFSHPVESGAEFIHGALPVTLQLLKEAGIEYEAVSGSVWQIRSGMLQQEEAFYENQALLEERLRELQRDMTVEDFINAFFSDEKHAAIRAYITGFAEGYDAADIKRASIFALRDEWMNEEAGANFRVKGGYIKMIDFLLAECLARGVMLQLHATVKEVTWSGNEVMVSCRNGKQFTGNKVIITVPLGVLLQQAGGESAISFTPEITDARNAIAKMGFGKVIKVLIEFRTAFWKQGDTTKRVGRDGRDLSFLISDAPIPTWWTQHPEQSTLLTGWLAGPAAGKWQITSEEFILEHAMQSLAAIFGTENDELKKMVVASQVANWAADEYTLGAYAYATLDTTQAIDTLNNSVGDTLFFAGEAFYLGPAMGTVEAALTSAIAVSKQILQ
ncbi:MAG: FAD-dependent oxidoreductase [Chitinophagales bacterium]|nr:FAD-dependent oxidoreductase [Chitinophagales bacterium]